MRYVSVTGNNHADALKRLREQYGPDVIMYGEGWVEAKSIFSKIVGKKQFKIEAAIQEKKKTPIKMSDEPEGSKIQKGLSDPSELITKSISSLPITPQTNTNASNLLNHDKKLMLNMIQKNRASTSPPPVKSFNVLGNLKSHEIEFLRNFIADMAMPSEKAAELYPSELKALYKVLQKQDFTHKFIDGILKNIYNELPQKQWKIFPVLYKKVADSICATIKTSSVFHKRAVAFIGTTGVGKTTMIAKIAADLKLKKDQTVTIITLDNYRVAATEQLKVYASIIDAPVYICKDPKKIKNIFFEDKADIFLIDTAGLSHKNNDFLMKQNEMLNALDYDIERHLILPAGSKPEDINEMITAFSYLNFDRIIISKMDETNRFGHLVETSNTWDKAFSFFSMGQKVPDDYIIADNRYLVDRILKGWKQ